MSIKDLVHMDLAEGKWEVVRQRVCGLHGECGGSGSACGCGFLCIIYIQM